ncbi:hypothetical protein BLNAU_394 [Blattamonas nauphoetae]|uniref:Eukaryotic translation initiation factor 3 subunit G N-terminal domain-containing protein n=1 Tax=Blattamonas nauphoetae TaxID=2049346 RepID=A0ABQ9YL52_9EUKA|nr:hypothetical protein BLNAU_394 [Blattamonas nauphoetae]
MDDDLYEIPDDINKDVIVSQEKFDDDSEILKIKHSTVQGRNIQTTIRTFKKTIQTERVPRAAAERRAAFTRKFGKSEMVSVPGEVIYLEPPPQTSTPTVQSKPKAVVSSFVCRNCGGPHLTAKCPNARSFAADTEQQATTGTQPVSRYASFGDNDYMVRLTNLPDGDIDMYTVENLLQPFTYIKCFPQRKRGDYAYEPNVVNVIFDTRQNALELIQSRIIYQNCVISCTWSRRDQERENKLKQSSRR